MMSHVSVCALLVFVLSNYSNGQSKLEPINKSIESETKANAPQSLVRKIIQDRNGNIWIATHGGILRYDGKSFTNTTSKITSFRFHCVLEDSKGNFWFPSLGSGVYYYDGDSFQNFTTNEGLVNDRALYVYEDRIGNIWFATEGGVSRYDGKSFQNFTTKEGLPHNDVITITEDKTGKLWFGTRGGACYYDGISFTILTKDVGSPFGIVRSIIEDKKGNIWLGGSNGLWRYNGSTFNNFTTKFVADIVEDKKGNIWTCSVEHGWTVSRYDAESSFKETIIAEADNTSTPILCIFEDSSGNIWFGAFGVYRYNGSTITFFTPD